MNVFSIPLGICLPHKIGTCAFFRSRKFKNVTVGKIWNNLEEEETLNMEEELHRSGRYQTRISFSKIEGGTQEKFLAGAKLQIRRKSSNIEDRSREALLESGKLQIRRRSLKVENGVQEELRLQMRRRSSIVDTPPWGEI